MGINFLALIFRPFRPRSAAARVAAVAVVAVVLAALPSSAADKPPAKPPPAKPAPPTAKPGDWVGGGGPGKANPGGKSAPVPVETGQKLAEAAATVDGATVTPLALGDLVDAAWSADAKFCYLLERGGVVRKASVPDWVEERRLDIGGPCANLVFCKAGLVVAVTGTQEVWLLDEKLDVKKATKVPGVRTIASAPDLQTVLASPGGDKVEVINPTLGRIVAEVTTKQVAEAAAAKDQAAARGVGFDSIVCSPDGRTLFAGAGGHLHKLRIEGAKLVFVQSSNWGGDNARGVCLSPDGRYVALPAGAGNSGGSDVGAYKTNVARADNLNDIATSLAGGAYPKAVGFDPKAQQIYIQNADTPLIVFSPRGQKVKDYHLGKVKAKAAGRLDVSKFLVHPDGKQVLVLGGGAYWVVLP